MEPFFLCPENANWSPIRRRNVVHEIRFSLKRRLCHIFVGKVSFSCYKYQYSSCDYDTYVQYTTGQRTSYLALLNIYVVRSNEQISPSATCVITAMEHRVQGRAAYGK
jgi:hypothetical protein